MSDTGNRPVVTPASGGAKSASGGAAPDSYGVAHAPARERGSKPVKKERPPRKITTGYRANVPFQRVSATKVRRVADNVRRKPYVEAMALLDVLPHKGARLLKKLIQSAAANALAQNKNLDEGMLYVKELLIDVGPSMKRMWARGRGRADRLLKRSCHISVVVDEIGAKDGVGKGVGNGSEG
jgi:large subunit ribosomal protein L22